MNDQRTRSTVPDDRTRWTFGLCVLLICLSSDGRAAVKLVLPDRDAPRIDYGASQLQAALDEIDASGTIRIGVADKDADVAQGTPPKRAAESFSISVDSGSYIISGYDESGAMYGCFELADRIRQAGQLPDLATPVFQSPGLRLRQSCVYMCLPNGSRDGGFYDFLWTPENFPWFYDKDHWRDYLDLLARSRFNALVLWAGHPFTSILRLPEFPEAQELSDQELERNIDMFRWVTREAERRGIWTVVHFYNIRISHSLAKHHKIGIGQSRPTKLTSKYTRHCVGEFIRNYPHVGLMVCLGEYLHAEFDAEWLADVIIAGVKDGLAPGQEEPPLIVRSHDCPMDEVLERASYGNLYTTSKYSSEALISHVVGGGPGNRDVMSWKFTKDLAEQHPHILELMFISNLQPCQYASPRFARGALRSCQDIGTQGVLHFPLAYLNWPYTTHVERTRQIDRDWMWYESWGRAAWNPKLTAEEDSRYWIARLGDVYGLEQDAAAAMLDTCEAAGEVMPHVTRALSNQPWNIQTHMLGQTMEQTLTISARWYAKPGETIAQFTQKELAGTKHAGETPVVAARAVRGYGETALRNAKRIESRVRTNKSSFRRWLRDIEITAKVGEFYAEKTHAAINAQLFFKTRNPKQLADVDAHLSRSLALYRELVKLTDETYASVGGWDACQQIPYRHPVTHWKQALPRFERELEFFRANAEHLREHPLSGRIQPYPPAEVTVLGDGCEPVDVKLGARPYTTNTPWIHHLLPELSGLTGVKFDSEVAESDGQPIEVELNEPARVFVAFFAGGKESRIPGKWAAPPEDWQFYAKEGVYLYKWHKYHMARCDVYVKELPAGKSVLSFGQGAFAVLGFAKRDVPLYPKTHRVVLPGTWFTHNYAK